MKTENTERQSSEATKEPFAERHPIFVLAAFSIAILAAALSYPAHLMLHGYQSDKLTSMAAPTIAAMRHVGATTLQCSERLDYAVTVRSEFIKLTDPRNPFSLGLCPTGLSIDATDGSVKILPVYADTVGEIEDRFKKQTIEDRQHQFEAVAKYLIEHAESIKQEVVDREAFGRKQELEAQKAKATWN
jgi:hypothetical protein